MAKAKKTAKKKEPKLKVYGSFDDVLGLSAQPMASKAKSPKKKKTKK